MNLGAALDLVAVLAALGRGRPLLVGSGLGSGDLTTFGPVQPIGFVAGLSGCRALILVAARILTGAAVANVRFRLVLGRLVGLTGLGSGLIGLLCFLLFSRLVGRRRLAARFVAPC